MEQDTSLSLPSIHELLEKPKLPYDDKKIMRRKPHKFPCIVSKILLDWLDNNKQYPYPSVEEKQRLIKLTNLSEVQINYWFSNARRRRAKMDRQTTKITPSAHQCLHYERYTQPITFVNHMNVTLPSTTTTIVPHAQFIPLSPQIEPVQQILPTAELLRAMKKA